MLGGGRCLEMEISDVEPWQVGSVASVKEDQISGTKSSGRRAATTEKMNSTRRHRISHIHPIPKDALKNADRNPQSSRTPCLQPQRIIQILPTPLERRELKATPIRRTHQHTPTHT